MKLLMLILLFIIGEMSGFVAGWNCAVDRYHIDISTKPGVE